jgi:hypothetical protein
VDDLEFFREWDNFGDSIDNLTYDLGVELWHLLSLPFVLI